MRKRKNRRLWLVVCALLVLCACLTGGLIFLRQKNASSTIQAPAPAAPATPVGLFSWGPAWLADRQEELFKTAEQLHITQLYQHVDTDALASPDLRRYLAKSSAAQMEVYYLTGDGEWGLDPSATQLKHQIDLLRVYNAGAQPNEQFAGILFDVEPYLTDSWDKTTNEDFALYTQIMAEAYEYARQYNIRVILCLPYWYDTMSEELLEQLIKSACDEAAFMNYNRKNEIKSLETEMLYCARYQKPLICIFEFQPPGVYELTENETYYNAGVDAALQSFDALKSHYGYENTVFAYHAFSVLPEILQRDA